MSAALTPYDTGDRLEPRPWSLESEEHYGLVDLDDDEGATVFTVVGKRRDDGSQGYLLSIDSNDEALTVEVNGDRALVLDEETLAGLDELIELAQRGRDDFIHQAGSTRDYTDADIAAADDQWCRAQRAVETIRGGRP